MTLYCDFCEDGLTHAQATIGGVPMCVFHMGTVPNEEVASMSGRLKLTLTDSQVEHLLLEAEENARMGVESYRVAWAAIERQCRKALAFAAARATPDREATPMADDDCCECVYGAEFLDDGVPHRYITTMCARCKKASEKVLDFLMVTNAQRQPTAGDT